MATLDLADDQRFALMKLRRNVADVRKPQHDDHVLLRWLRARDFDVEAAEKMYRDSLQWRETWKVDTLPTWKAPGDIDKYYPSGLSGFDNDGSPVVIVPFAGLDIWGMLHTIRKTDFIYLTLQRIEYFVSQGEEQAKKYGQKAYQVVIIMDMENFNIKQYAWRPAGEIIITLIQMYEANYPEVLKACYIINAPKIFAFAFSIVKKFMKEYTINKIHIYKNEPEKWKPLLLKSIPAESIPVYFGGTMVDPDGNPKCITKINQGGKVPKSQYYKKPDKNANKENVNQVVIKKGGRHEIPFITTEDGCILKWEFKSDNHDIKFGVTFTDIDGNDSVAIPIQKVNCHPIPEKGEISCQSPATYTVIFDNSHSILRSKTIHYTVGLYNPNIKDAEETS